MNSLGSLINFADRSKMFTTNPEYKSAFEERITELGYLINNVIVYGRIVSTRNYGNKLSFFDIQDRDNQMQMMLNKRNLGDHYSELVAMLQVGNIVRVSGDFGVSNTGEYTVFVKDLEVLSTSDLPMPDKYHGISDAAIQRSKRYLDLLANSNSRERFVFRSNTIQRIRQFLYGRGYIEVETPVLDTVYGGAEATPFTTHCEGNGNDLFMRIAPEFYLKQLIVGGMERVFEIGKQFRNEGFDATHHPEFTSIELYEAYANYKDMARIANKLFLEIGFIHEEMRSMTMIEAIELYTGWNMSCNDDAEIMAVFEEQVEPKLIEPTIIFDFPASYSPLALVCENNPKFAQRFEIYANGMEIANAYSEQNNAKEQRRRIEEQKSEYGVDENFLSALEYGMPPTGGMGIGLDRVIMIMTNSTHIQDVILFPLR